MIIGVDVSYWQGKIDWKKMKPAGAEFAFIRAGQGFGKDTRFVENGTGARGRLLRSAYQFFDYRASPAGQAQTLMGWLGSDRGEMAPTFDWERNPYWEETMPSGAGALAIIKAWVDEIKRLDGRKPIFYSNPSHIAALGAIPDWLRELPLFIANYGVSKPSFTGWSDWAFWQYALGKGRGPEFGTTGLDIDLDYFNGTLEQLHAFAGVTLPAPEPEPEPEQPPEEEKPPMGLYSNRARGVFLWEAHKASDFAALKGKIDFVVVYAGQGDMPAANFKENIKAARAVLGVPVLAYVSLLPDLYQGLDFNPAKFWTGKAEPHVKMLSNNLHYASGLSESIDGVVYDFSDYTMADGKTENNDNWAAALAEHVTNQLFAYFKKPVYPLCKPAFAAKFTNPGGAVANLFNSWGAISYVAANAVTVLEDGVRIPADTEGPRPPFISAWDFWWYGSQSFTGLAAAAALFLYKSTPAALYKELNFTGQPTEPEPEDPPVEPPPDDEEPPVTGDFTAVLTKLAEISTDVKIIKAFIEDMRKL